MNSDRTRALVLDFGCVISKTLFETHREAEQILGLAPGTLNWMGPFAPAQDELWRSMQNDDISEREYYNIRAREVGKLIGQDWHEATDFILATHDDTHGPHLRSEALQAMQIAHDCGVKLALLTGCDRK